MLVSIDLTSKLDSSFWNTEACEYQLALNIDRYLTCCSTVHDARVAFQIHQGIALTFIFGAKETVEQWHPMRMLRSLKEVVSRIENTTVGMNVICDL